METLLSDSHLGPHTKLKVYPTHRATRPTLEKQSVSSRVHFNGKPAFLSTAKSNGGREYENRFVNRNQLDKVGSPSKGLGVTFGPTSTLLPEHAIATRYLLRAA